MVKNFSENMENIKDNEEIKKLKQENMKLKEALKKSEEANNNINEIIRIVSHEMRTPLSGIIGISELLMNDGIKREDFKELSELIYNTGYRLINFIDELLESSLIDAGKFRIENSEFDLKKLAKEIDRILSFKIKDNSNILIFNYKSNSIIKSDENKIRHLLFNFISNAYKHTFQGVITVTFDIKDKNYYFEINDTGSGIDEKDFKKIFNMFQQLKPKSYKAEGYGLGLTICKKIIDAMGGEINIKSSIGKGSTFSFTIPIEN